MASSPIDLGGLPDDVRPAFEQLLKYLGPIRELVFFGLGSPEGVVTATRAIYIRLDGGVNTTLYIKQSGAATNTGWSPVTP